MKLLRLAAPVLLGLMACNERVPASGSAASDTATTTGTTAAPAAACYRYTGNGDTVNLRLDPTGSGPLEYQLKEKDRNRGTFTIATNEGGLLRGWYRFQSEGMESVREEVFRKDGDALVPGYGEIVQQGDTARFAPGAALQFDSKRALRPVECGGR
ncbi:hypothetical protein [Flaviaesturariibacter aridisoli]|uniref:Lipoprotein n=1 Tax=Flaviaesturariibacter aridisoli TaxID=2545761 RepID=A0A4R4E5M0_9BACT|nr:hypothetical protein [Flaviaesturariibacter aridisoli]TCZ72948.1 hypothetical protein E0486_07745 [Flaviaesturariibacter aridisoli]